MISSITSLEMCVPTIFYQTNANDRTQFALRWRTEEEVLSGAGESTCGNTRCAHHHGASSRHRKPSLTTLELPFVYLEHGETRSALVKVVLCEKCLNKLMWKRRKDKEKKEKEGELEDKAVEVSVTGDPTNFEGLKERARETSSTAQNNDWQDRHARRRNSRSRSPRSRLRSPHDQSHRRHSIPRPLSDS